MKIEVLASLIFAVALIHSFCVQFFILASNRFPKESFMHGFLHLLGEIEVVFGFWAGCFAVAFAFLEGSSVARNYFEDVSFTEPIFVFVIMVISSTKPVLYFSELLLSRVSRFFQKIFKTKPVATDLFVLMTFGPLLGSFITEPAAMTLSALLLLKILKSSDEKILYPLLATLFVNVSVGGTLTHFAAPPILMVAQTWGWDWRYVFSVFGVNALTSVGLNTLCLFVLLGQKVESHFLSFNEVEEQHVGRLPFWIIVVHLIFLVLVVVNAHNPKICLGLFLFFLGVVAAAPKYQNQLKLREGLLVGFFLGGLVVFGPFQEWWLSPILKSLSDFTLYLGATGLTAIADNAALTYLGSKVEGLSEAGRFSLVAGAVVGGGLTVIANAPNPAGVSILQKRFRNGVIAPLSLLKAALLPTFISFLCFWLMPH